MLRDMQKSVSSHRTEIKKVLSGEDARMLVIVGPCSAWPFVAVCNYADKLKNLQDKLDKKIKIVMRVYVQKSRTRDGWLGPFIQPDPFGRPDVKAGIQYAQQLFQEITKRGVAIAAEIVFPQTAHYFDKYIAWGAIGARCSENTEHRLFASGAEYPVGIKNVTGGFLDVSMNGVYVAQQKNVRLNNKKQNFTQGNVYAHLVLRGSFEGINFDARSFHLVNEIMVRDRIKNPAVLVDASHGNAVPKNNDKAAQQIVVLEKLCRSRKKDPVVRRLMKGVMIESFLKHGSQNLVGHNNATIDRSGLSITDPCLGWEETEQIIQKMYELF